MCYEDLRQLYASAAKERDELKKDFETRLLPENMTKDGDGNG